MGIVSAVTADYISKLFFGQNTVFKDVYKRQRYFINIHSQPKLLLEGMKCITGKGNLFLKRKRQAIYLLSLIHI